MTPLSDTQALILSAAAQRPENIALPLPKNLRGGAAAKVVGAMIAKGFLERMEVYANPYRGEPFWLSPTDGHFTTLVATVAGLAAIGIVPEDAHTARVGAQEAATGETARDTATATEPAPTAHTQREGTKQAALIAMLRAPKGATLAEIVAVTGWQKHTARAFMSGALKKRLGLIVTSEWEDRRGRVYRVVDAGPEHAA
ncbi:MAG: DUF3489 domain-containing protein [Pseudorhodobacter sp.]|nr:DUF3489 domain-containing protein [Pseudorhodobacter sp.]